MVFHRLATTANALILSLFLAISTTSAQRDSVPEGYPESLIQHLQRLLSTNNQNMQHWLELADVYLNMGDDLFTKDEDRISAYEKGYNAALHALERNEKNADAHFLYAANLGNAAKLRGMTTGALKIKEILAHVRRAVELQPNHAPSQQMLGGLLAELPWFLGGDFSAAQRHLERAINIDEGYTNARILLAKLLIQQGKTQAARQQLLAVINTDQPHYPYTWARQFKPQAEKLLNRLQE